MIARPSVALASAACRAGGKEYPVRGFRTTLVASLAVAALAWSSVGVVAQGDDQPLTGQLEGDGWMVWQGPTGLTLARLDGSEQGLLFSDGTADGGHADWSPDGTMLAYVRDEPDGTADIRVIGRDGGDDGLLIDCAPPCAFAEEPAWSPDGTRIAYWYGSDDTQDIRVADATTGETLLTVPSPDPLIGPITPRWSPDGRYLTAHAEVYEQVGDDYQLVDGRIGIIDLEADEPAMELITPAGMQAMYPDWSPDGTRILFVAGNLDPFFGSDDPNDLYTVLPDGTDLQRLTDRTAGEARFGTPTWTKARPPIVVTLIQGGAYTLGALEEDGSGLREIHDAGGRPLPGAHPRVWVEP